MCKRLGVKFNELPQSQKGLIQQSIDQVLSKPNATLGNDLEHAVQSIRSAFNTVSHHAVGAPSSAPSSRHIPTPPVVNGQHGSSQAVSDAGASTQRRRYRGIAAEKRDERLERDSQWLKEVERDVEVFQQQRDLEREQRMAKLNEQKQFLEQQMEQQKHRKEDESETLRREMNRVIAATQKELDQERKDQEAAKMKMVKERTHRERMMNEQVQRRQEDKARRIQEEREYLSLLNGMDQASIQQERDRKQQQRQEFQRFIEANKVQEMLKREERDRIRDAERQEIRRMNDLAKDRERQAQNVVNRHTARGIQHSRRQETILKQYQEQLAEMAEDEQREAAKRQQIQQMNEQRERELEQQRKEKKLRQKEDLVKSLEAQIESHQQNKLTHRAVDANYRDASAVANVIGVVSDEEAKALERIRKEQLVRTLNEQMRQNKRKRTQDPITKIG